MPSVQHSDLSSIHRFAYTGADPGPVGAYKGWVDTTSTPVKFYIRSGDNTTWLPVSTSGTSGSGTTLTNFSDLDALVTTAIANPTNLYSANLTGSVAIPNSRTIATGAMTIPTKTVASVSTSANTITITGHGFANGEAVIFSSSGTVPAPLVAGTTYFAIVIDANTIKLVATYSFTAITDTSQHIDLTTAGTGTITVQSRYPQTPGTSQRTLTVGSSFFTAGDVGKWIKVSGAGYNGGDLLTPISSYVSATQVVLVGSTGATITGATVSVYYQIPKNILITAVNGGGFVSSGGGLLDIKATVSVPAIPLFSGFGVGGVKFSGAYPENVYPEWFGAKGDTVLDDSRHYISGTDDLAAFNAMLASSGKVVGDYTVGALHIVLTTGRTYYLTDTLNVDTQVLMEGHSITQTVTPALKFAANKTGIVQHGLSTNTGGYLLKPYRVADASVFRNFAVLGTVGTTNLNVSVGLETIDAVPNTITLNRNSGAIDFSAGNGFQNGNTITIGAWSYVFDNVQSATKVTLKKPRLMYYSFATAGAPSPYIYRGSYEPYDTTWVNQKIRLQDNQVYKILAIDPAPAEFPTSDRITLGDVNTGLPLNYVPYGNTDRFTGTAYLESLSITNQNARANIYHGIDLRTTTDISGMMIREFAGNGIEANTQASPSWNLGNVPNINNSKITRNTLYQNYGSGLRMFGINSNQVLIDINDASYNKGAGYMEQSFLGNTYVGNHSSYNVFAPHYADTAANSSLFVNEYEEGDGSSSRFGPYNMLLGGNINSGGGIDTIFGTDMWITPEQGQIFLANLKLQTTANNVTAGFLSGDTSGTIYGFTGAEEPINTGSGGSAIDVRSPAYRLRYYPISSDPYHGYYAFEYGGNLSKIPFLMSGGNSSDGTGKLWIPSAFYIGYPGSPARHVVSADADGMTVNGNKVLTALSGAELPTSDPHVSGELWNNAGVVTVSAG